MVGEEQRKFGRLLRDAAGDGEVPPRKDLAVAARDIGCLPVVANVVAFSVRRRDRMRRETVDDRRDP